MVDISHSNLVAIKDMIEQGKADLVLGAIDDLIAKEQARQAEELAGRCEGLIEQKAMGVAGLDDFGRCVLSTAISLRRIADKLDLIPSDDPAAVLHRVVENIAYAAGTAFEQGKLRA